MSESLGDGGITGQVLLKYLPAAYQAAYQDDRKSREFLENFLGIFAKELDASERLIANISNYFDPLAVDRPGLMQAVLSCRDETVTSWLALWLSLDLYELLGDQKNREYLLKATEFFKRKGTARGLEDLAHFLTGGKECRVKEYINNVFRSWGMEHCAESNNDTDCRNAQRGWSKTVDTGAGGQLADMGTFNDNAHYTWDSSKDGLYSPYSIGLFITVMESQSLKFDEKYQEQLKKIIESFLPALVKLKIRIITITDEPYPLGTIDDAHEDHVQITYYEAAMPPEGSYRNKIPGVETIYTYKDEDGQGKRYRTNDPNYWTYMLLHGVI